MPTRFSIAIASLACSISVFASTPSLAAWSANGVTVKATNSTIPLVEACPDGVTGTFVVWQEESSAGQGVLRAQHLLASGDLDPSWPASGALVTSTVIGRKTLGTLPDRLGGLYVWWKEGNTLLATRLAASGTVAAGWPATGRVLGSIYPFSPVPSVIEDGVNGFYAAWARGGTDPIAAIHLGPSNTGAGGWPNSTRSVAPPAEVSTLGLWPRLALAPDGGIFVGWASWSSDTTVVPSAWLLRRLTSAGLNAAGWPFEGRTFGAFRLEVFDTWLPPYALYGLSNDGRGGVFFLTGSPVGNDGYRVTVENRLYRRQADGETATDWPDEGRIVTSLPDQIDNIPPFDRFDYRVVHDRIDGAFVGAGGFGADGPGLYRFQRHLASGVVDGSAGVFGTDEGFAMVPKADGGAFLANFSADGKHNFFDTDAFLSVAQSLPAPGWSNWLEIHTEIVQHWFGDIGLALLSPTIPSDPEGAVLYWSQANQRFGLFARAFTTRGEVTGVPEVRSSLALRRVWFDARSGIRASVALPGGAARLELFDVSGRRLAAQRLESAGSRDVTLAGTSALPSGLYFARLSSSSANAIGRAIVTH